ncbi:hypothetical protein C8F01DRAFT_1255785 [Mycena amicta]|nr:hypothetical protein C8F01DRAFT_1255785 [Mycena amicta]
MDVRLLYIPTTRVHLLAADDTFAEHRQAEKCFLVAEDLLNISQNVACSCRFSPPSPFAQKTPLFAFEHELDPREADQTDRTLSRFTSQLLAYRDGYSSPLVVAIFLEVAAAQTQIKGTTMSPKAKFVRKAKAERHNLKFWADGIRETEILLPRLPEYMDALAQGWRAERTCLDSICNEYHARIPWTVGDNEEPEELLPYDKYAPAVEEDLTDEQRKAKFARIQLLNAMRCIKRPPKACSLVQQFLHEEKDRLVAPEVAHILTARKLQSGADDDDDAEEKENGKRKKKKNTIDINERKTIARKLMERLFEEDTTGAVKADINERKTIARKLMERLFEEDTTGAVKADINERKTIARKLMERLFEEDTTGAVKAGYEQRRWAESAAALDAWTHLKTVGAITEVLKEIHAITGLRILCLMGGPVSGLPEDDPFATMAISIGKNNAPCPVGFPKFDPKRIPFFKQYLKTCFSKPLFYVADLV